MDKERMIKLKVCGMKESKNILDVAELQPDYMGFIFFQGSRRFVGDNFYMPINFPATIRKVGVFVNEVTDEIVRLAVKHELEFIQLHGNESAKQCETLKKKQFSIIKAFSIGENFNFDSIDAYKEHVDYFLFDTWGENYGGNGIVFDWTLLKQYDQSIPFFLSGGISASNVIAIKSLSNMNIHAIDVNSGVEKSIGIKNPKLISDLKLSVF